MIPRTRTQEYPPFAHQKGTSLIEVLVALLVLAVAALGYSLLQARSLGSVDESMMRMQAQLILREATERIRSNSKLEGVMDQYQTAFTSNTSPTISECLLIDQCSSAQIVQNDVAALRTHATSKGITLGMVTCPMTQTSGQTQCLVAAWNETLPSYATGASSSSTDSGQQSSSTSQENIPNSNIGCLNRDGSYLTMADCLYIEAY